MIGKLEGEHKKHLAKLTQTYNLTRSAITRYSPHFLMFGQRPRLPKDFLFPTHEVMGKIKPIDAYVMAKLFQTMSTMMLPETPCQEVNAECQPLSKLETDVNA